MNERQQSIHERIMGARDATDAERTTSREGETASSRSARRRWPFMLLAGGAFIVLAGGGFGLYHVTVFAEVIAQVTGRGTGTSESSERGSAATADLAAAGPFVKHAADAGVQTCAATYAGLGKALTGGTQYMVQSETGKTDADSHSLQGLVGMVFDAGNGSGYSGPAAGLVFAAPTPKGCEGTMVRVVPFQQDCQTAANLLPQGSQQVQPLTGLPVFRLSTGGQVMLVPSSNGCVALSILRASG